MNPQHFVHMYPSHETLERTISHPSEACGFFDQMYVETSQALEMQEGSQSNCRGFHNMCTTQSHRPDGPAERPSVNG